MFNLLDELMHIKIEISAQCNSRCIMCYPKTSFEKRGWGNLMTFALFQQIIAELAKECEKPIDLNKRKSIINNLNKNQINCGFSADALNNLSKGKLIIHLFGIGESFINPEFLNMLKYLKAKSNDAFYVILNTNCSLFNKENIKEILDLSLIDELYLSIDSHDTITFEKIRKGLSYDLIIGNVNLLLDLAKNYDNPPKISIHAVRLEENSDSLNETINYFNNLGLNVNISDDVRSKIKKRHSYRCPKIDHMLMVCADGKVIKCIFDYDGCTYVGNANKQPLRDIWLGSLHQKFQFLNMTGQLSQIKICKEACLNQ